MTAADRIATWPRERVATAVRFARSYGAAPEAPLDPDPRKWPAGVADTVEAADELSRRGWPEYA